MTDSRPLPARNPGTAGEELDLLLREITALSGVACRVGEHELDAAVRALVQEQGVKRAVLWDTPWLAALRIAPRLEALGVTLVAASAGKHALAECDLGVTEVDYALPETGTLALLSSPQKPRSVSLLPRVHLALLQPAALRADLHQVFTEAKTHDYLIFITGPSRTADIELTLTIGVHGPQALYVWAVVSS